MKRSNMLIGIAAALVLITVVIVRAQSTPGDGPTAVQRRTIVASGSGTILTRPDSVRVYLGIVTEAKTVTAARDENARAVTKVQDAVLALKLTDLKARTRDTDVRIVKRRSRRDNLLDDEDANATIAGYRVSQTFSVVFQANSVEELAGAAGRILDAALQNGVNERGEVEFFLADDSGLQRGQSRPSRMHCQCHASRRRATRSLMSSRSWIPKAPAVDFSATLWAQGDQSTMPSRALRLAT